MENAKNEYPDLHCKCEMRCFPLAVLVCGHFHQAIINPAVISQTPAYDRIRCGSCSDRQFLLLLLLFLLLYLLFNIGCPAGRCLCQFYFPLFPDRLKLILK